MADVSDYLSAGESDERSFDKAGKYDRLIVYRL